MAMLLSECPVEHSKCIIKYKSKDSGMTEYCMCRCYSHANPGPSESDEEPEIGIGRLFS
jgi:hypothetical protein